MAVTKKQSFDTFYGTAAERALFADHQLGDKYVETDTGLKFASSGSAWVSCGTTLTGSLANRRGLAANKPLATAVDVGTTYWSVDTDPHADVVEVSNGTTWVVM